MKNKGKMASIGLIAIAGFIVGLIAAPQVIHASQSYVQCPAARSTTIEFAWDAHDVLFKKNRRGRTAASTGLRSHRWEPMEGMAQLIKELNDLGYTQRIATNANTPRYKKLVAQNANILGYLDGGLTVNRYESPVVRKPSQQYFERYCELYNSDRIKKIIFIDDKAANVAAAQRSGMIGIVFQDVKQLRMDLRALGIPVQEPAIAEYA